MAVPTVSPSESLLVFRTIYPGVLRCVARYGYTDVIRHDSKFVASILAQVGTYVSTPNLLLMNPCCIAHAANFVIPAPRMLSRMHACALCVCKRLVASRVQLTK